MVNRENYKIAKRHLVYLDEVQQLDNRSIGRYWSYLKHSLVWLDQTPLWKAHTQRPTLPDYVAELRSDSGKALAQNTQKKIVETTRRLIEWARDDDPRLFRDIAGAWLKTLHKAGARSAADEHVFVTLEEVLALARLKVPEDDLPLRRDQAAACFLFLSGMRAGAFASLPIKALDVAKRIVRQWPELGVWTKNSKKATTYLLAIQELLEVIEVWDRFIRGRLPPDAMWYTSIDGRWGDFKLTADKPGRNRNASLAKRLRRLFEFAEMPYKHPHAFRHGHAVYALERCQTMAEYQAVSVNMMHGNVTITDEVYARLPGETIGDRIAGISGRQTVEGADAGDLRAYLRRLPRRQKATALRILADEMEG